MTKLFKCILFLTLTTSFSFADGGDVGNGGDECERQFLNVKDELHTWLTNDNSYLSLELSEAWSHQRYQQEMVSAINSAKVSCTDKKIMVRGLEKVCKNYSLEDGTSQIECNVNRFLNLKKEEKYVLVHHEYAGVAGLEVNQTAQSDYTVSNQISQFFSYFLDVKLGSVSEMSTTTNITSFCENGTLNSEGNCQYGDWYIECKTDDLAEDKLSFWYKPFTSQELAILSGDVYESIDLSSKKQVTEYAEEGVIVTTLLEGKMGKMSRVSLSSKLKFRSFVDQTVLGNFKTTLVVDDKEYSMQCHNHVSL